MVRFDGQYHGWIIHKDEEIEESWMDEVEKCIKSVCDHTGMLGC